MPKKEKSKIVENKCEYCIAHEKNTKRMNFLSYTLIFLIIVFLVILSQEQKIYNKNSPSDWIKDKDITIHQDKICIFGNYKFGVFESTLSMDPTLDKFMFSIIKEKKYFNVSKLQLGDIIAFTYVDEHYNKENVIHRIVETGEDQYGWFAKTKGDNVKKADPGVRREEDVSGVVIGVLY